MRMAEKPLILPFGEAKSTAKEWYVQKNGRWVLG
jgi:hypothetical protein